MSDQPSPLPLPHLSPNFNSAKPAKTAKKQPRLGTHLSRLGLSLILAAAFPLATADTGKPATAVPAGAEIQNANRPVSGLNLEWMDKSIRPQDDFFRFMSGKWLQSNPIPADRARYGAFDQLGDTTRQRIHQIVQELAAKKDLANGSEQQKIADLYTSVMDEAGIDQAGLKPLLPLLAEIDAIGNREQLAAMLARLQMLGVDTPFSAVVSADARNAREHAFYLGQHGLSLPDRDYLLKEEDKRMQGFRSAWINHLQDMLQMAGPAFVQEGSTVQQQAQTIFALEKEIARVQWPRSDHYDPAKTYNKHSLEQLKKLVPGFDWDTYFKASGFAGKMESVIVRHPSYFSGLNKLLETRNLQEWKLWLKWKTLNSYAPLLSRNFANASLQFHQKTLRGIPELTPRWERAVSIVEESVPEALGKIYVARHFPPEHKARMQQMVNNLQLAYRQSLENLPWMSAATRRQALEKLGKFTAKIGYPDTWRDYSALHIKRNDPVGNMMRVRQFQFLYKQAKLGQKVDRNEWGMSPQTVNAYYNPRQNEIVFPAAMLQPPFFNAQAEDAVNYGGIGGVIGHEIGHGFDNLGSQSDGEGNLRNWWQDEDRKNFDALGQALSKQYEAEEPLPGYKVDGKLTLGENIADTSGLAIAFKAYQLSLQGKAAPVLDGYSGEQRVFMGWAQAWRSAARNEEILRRLKSDSHSPGSLRCNLPLRNFSEFARVFGVKEGDGMYLPVEKRISIW